MTPAEQAAWNQFADTQHAALIAHHTEQDALLDLLGDCLPTNPPEPTEDAA